MTKERKPSAFVNGAGILASDGPGEVVRKLDAAYDRVLAAATQGASSWIDELRTLVDAAIADRVDAARGPFKLAFGSNDWKIVNILWPRLDLVADALDTSAGPVVLPLESAPRDGTIIRLLVEFEEGNLEDSPDPQWTIGGNTFDNTGIDQWQFAGWNWEHDVFTEGTGEPIGWLPMLSAPPSHEGEDARDATCGWKEDVDWDGTVDSYSTACGSAWRFDDGTAQDNGMNYCHHCGKPVRVIPWRDEADAARAGGAGA